MQRISISNRFIITMHYILTPNSIYSTGCLNILVQHLCSIFQSSYHLSVFIQYICFSVLLLQSVYTVNISTLFQQYYQLPSEQLPSVSVYPVYVSVCSFYSQYAPVGYPGFLGCLCTFCGDLNALC